MSVRSLSFWQQNQNYWYRVSQSSQKLATEAALITGMGNAITSETQGKSAIANQSALNRVNTELSAALQSAIAGQTGSSSNKSSGSSTGSKTASPAASTSGKVATGTGTVPLSVTTPLSTLGIINKNSLIISDGTNTTVYTSNGSDTVSDLIGTINADAAKGQAQVTASLNGSGHLVIAGKYLRDVVSISGDNPSALGFGPNNNTFSPTLPAAPTAAKSSSSASASSSKSASSSGTSGSSASSSTSSSNSKTSPLLNSASNLQTDGTAEILMASAGSAGNILNMLA